MALTPKQRAFLKGLAHPLSPVVRVGRGGIDAGVVAETRRSLEAHELIKVRIEADAGLERRDLGRELARETDAELVGLIGKTAMLYRRRDGKPDIQVPPSRKAD